MFTGDNACRSNLIYKGYQLEIRRAPSGWRVGDLPAHRGFADPQSMRSA
jgi:hypothetical protein